ncbi:MAG: prolyl-tRNA synthetase associated domain-containing protein [Nanoarchaeota archaeon]|nr:prolyl-tRNA synthetase associated domain-containing protein [Nanoarchaeota archaeon]
MEPKLKSYLEKNKISYMEHKHLAVFTVEEAKKIKDKLPTFFHTKNLFLKDEDKNYFLVCMDAYKKLDIKILKQELEAKKKLSFCSPEILKEKLNLTPGSVSIFGMINASPGSVKLIIDKEVWDAEKVGFHPNINTATLELTHENLKKFVETLENEYMIIDLPSKDR